MSPELLLSTILPRSSQDDPCDLVAACPLTAMILLRCSHVLVVMSSVVATESTQGSVATTMSPDIVDRREVSSEDLVIFVMPFINWAQMQFCGS